MYLKRLDLQGFKSFATRTAFEFGPGITTIVGPNGSGKSNVADALRCVLGEGSGRLLRARRLDEVVFAGSSRRAAAKAAEVTITLDNSDGWLPIEFAEVAVRRRVTHNGDSDFYINGKRVRLKDVTDLFLRASASQSSYAIIGQGLVETVLGLRPEERRLLLEEAADVQRYRVKLDEAQNRLAATRDNMERVELLVSEITPRLNQLGRQAGRAARHAQLSQELSDALRAWYGHQWHECRSALNTARLAVERRREEEARAEAEIKTWDEQLAAVQEELARRRASITDRVAQRQRLTEEIAVVQQRIADSRHREGSLIGRREQLQLELEAMEKEMLGLARASVDDSRRGVALEQELETSRNAQNQAQQQLESLEHDSSGMSRQSATGQEKAARARAAVGDIEARLRNLADTRRRLGEERTQQEERRRSLVSQMGEVARQLRDQRVEERRLSDEAAVALQEQEALNSRIGRGRASLAALQESCRLRDLEIERLQARLGILSDAQQAHEARTRASAAPLTESGEMTVQGLLGVVSSLIRVPKGLDQAIEAALAENLQAILVERQKDALAVIETLARQKAGRVVILPLDGFKEVYPLNITKERDVVGVASRLVKCDDRYRRVVDTLLGRTIVVKDLETALRIVKRGMGSVVTRDGVFLHPTGAISSGQPTSEGNIFARQQELTSIPGSIERLIRSRKAADEEMHRLHSQVTEDEASLRSVGETLATLQEQRPSVQDAIAQGRRVLAQLRGEMRWLMTSQHRLDQQLASLVLEEQRLAEEKESNLAQAAESEEVAQYLRSAAAVFEERRRGLLKNVTEASTKVASLEGEMRSLSLIRENRQATLSRLDGQMTSKQAELRGLELESTSLTDSIDAQWRDAQRLSDELKSYADDVEPAQQAIAALEGQEREVRAKAANAQSRLLAAERQRLEAEAQVRRHQDELQSLRQRVETDGLTIRSDGEVVAAKSIEEQEEEPTWMPAGDRYGDGQETSLPPIAGGALIDPQTMEERVQRLRNQLRAVGPVNPQAEAEYEELNERHTFLTSQLEDLQTAERSLVQAIEELDEVVCERFKNTFLEVAEQFSRCFTTFFGGGQAKLTLSTPDDYRTSGVEIVAQPPGKRLQSLNMLSGGEKALTAVALLFALLQTNPSPFCVLDEVDAMLDEANVGRFVAALQELAQRTQFIVITHNRRTIEVADNIYGISMGDDSISRVLSLRLADVSPN